jgi:hypothetical protein
MLSLIKPTFGTAAQPLTLTLSPFRRGEGIGRRNVNYLTPSSVRPGKFFAPLYAALLCRQVGQAGKAATSRRT